MSLTKTLTLTLFITAFTSVTAGGQTIIPLEACGVPYVDPQDEAGGAEPGQDTLLYEEFFAETNQLRRFYIDVNAFGGQQVDRVHVEAILPDGSAKSLGRLAFGGCADCVTGFTLLDNDSLVATNVADTDLMNLWIESLSQPAYALPSNLQTLVGVGRISGGIPFCAVGWRARFIVSSNPASTSTEFSTYIHCPEVVDPCVITTSIDIDCPSGELLLEADVPAACFVPPYTVRWTGPQGQVVEQASAVQPLAGNLGWWRLTVEDDCCRYADSILVENPPFVEAGPDETVCQGATLFLAGEGGTGHYWETPPDGAPADSLINLRNIQPEMAGAYVLHGFNEEGCEDTDTLLLSVLVPPIPELVLSEGCLGDTFTMSAPNDTLFTTIDWLGPLGNSVSPIIPDLQPEDFGDYILVATDPQGCEVRDTFAVTGRPLPEFFFTTERSCDSTRVYLAPDSLDYQWETGATGTTFATPAGGEYALTITDAAGCRNRTVIEVPAPDGPEVDLEITQPVCPQDRGRLRILPANPNAPLIFSVDGGEHYSLSTDFRDLSPGIYEVVVQDDLGCLRRLEAVIKAPDTMGVSIGVERLDVRPGTAIELSAQTVGNIQVHQWLPEIIDTGLPTTEFIATNDLDIRIIVEDDRGCKASDGFPLNIVLGDVYTPNAFSPNGDGVNDRFTLYSDNGSLEIIERLRIFDRWGGLVFEAEEFALNDERLGWDGRRNGQLLRPGIYTYHGVVRFGNGVRKHYEGGVLLIR